MPWWPILIALVGIGIGIGIAISALSDVSTTSSSQLEVGDCFESPDDNFEQVANQDCASAHDAQIYAQLDAERSNQFTAGDECQAELIAVIASDNAPDSITLPDDTRINQISDGAGTVYCTIESPSGSLVGSLFPE